MKFVSISLMGLILILLYFQSEWQSRPSHIDLGPSSQREVLDESLSWTIEGQAYSLKDFKGKALYINFWAYWCAPCLREIPEIQSLAQELDPEKAKIVLINMDEKTQDLEKAKSFLKDQAPQLQSSFEKNSSFIDKIKPLVLPYHLLIDQQGRIAMIAYGNNEDTVTKIKDWLLQLAQEEEH